MTKISRTTTTSGKPQVVFFGTGPVAAASLASLLAHTVVEAVITKPVPPHHREAAPVETLAAQHSLNTLFVRNKVELDTLIEKQQFTSKLGIIVDFGVIVSQATIDYFPFGIINAHFSLLPRWRGADPISFAILAGDQKTGVSLMLIEPTLDTGKLIVQKSLPITADDTTPSLTDKLVALSNELLSTYIPLHLAGETKPRSQPHQDRATFSRKLTKADSLLDWTKSAADLEREIRAFAEWPKSRTTLAGKDVIITRAHAVPSNFSNSPGDIEVVKDISAIMVNCAEGYLCIDALKPAGKKEMTAAAFLAGYGHLFANE